MCGDLFRFLWHTLNFSDTDKLKRNMAAKTSWQYCSDGYQYCNVINSSILTQKISKSDDLFISYNADNWGCSF